MSIYKYFFGLTPIKYFDSKSPEDYIIVFFENKEYSNEELIDILKNKPITKSIGNAIVLVLIERLNKKIKDLDS